MLNIMIIIALLAIAYLIYSQSARQKEQTELENVVAEVISMTKKTGDIRSEIYQIAAIDIPTQLQQAGLGKSATAKALVALCKECMDKTASYISEQDRAMFTQREPGQPIAVFRAAVLQIVEPANEKIQAELRIARFLKTIAKQVILGSGADPEECIDQDLLHVSVLRLIQIETAIEDAKGQPGKETSIQAALAAAEKIIEKIAAACSSIPIMMESQTQADEIDATLRGIRKSVDELEALMRPLTQTATKG